MKATEFIRLSLASSQGWAMGLISDMKDAPLTQPTPNGGNHPLWVLGHLAYSESQLIDCYVRGESNRFPEWKALFDGGTTPSTDAGVYPSMAELMEKSQEMRAATLAHLETLADDDLDKKSHAPKEATDFFGTVGACFAALAIHTGYHAGQVADARRAAGRKTLFA